MRKEKFDAYIEENLPELYHSTSDSFKMDKLLSAGETENLREDFRKDNLQYVF